MVAAIAAFSESPAMGMYATRSHAATISAGRPSRSAPTSSVIGPSAGPRSGSARWAGVGHQRDALPRQLRDRPRARKRHVEDRAHAGPHRLGRPRVGAARAERHARGAEGVSRAQHRADVAGIGEPVQVDAQRPQRAWAPALLVHADRACSRPERADRRQRRRLHIEKARATELAASDPIALHGPPPRVGGSRKQILALGEEAAAARALAAALQAPQLLQAGVVGGGDGRRGASGICLG